MGAVGRIQNAILFQSRRPHTQGCPAGRNAVPFLAVFITDHKLLKEAGRGVPGYEDDRLQERTSLWPRLGKLTSSTIT